MPGEYTVRFRPLPWVQQRADWIADIDPFFYRVSFFDWPALRMHDGTGKPALDDDGKVIKQPFSAWMAWPFGDMRRGQFLGAGLHPSSTPYVCATTAERCMALVDKAHHAKIAQHLELVTELGDDRSTTPKPHVDHSGGVPR